MSSFFLDKDNPDEAHTNMHVMLDLETMGVNIGSPIITIGAVLFDPMACDTAQALEARGFLARVDIKDAVENSIGVDPGTLKWWLEQDDAAIKALLGGAVTAKGAIGLFRQYCKHRWPKGDDLFFEGHSRYPQACQIWAKSPDFDCKMLEWLCKQVGEPFPFNFHEWRCVRTAQDLAWPNGPDSRPKFAVGTAHDARADAVSQALMIQAAYQQLGLSSSITMEAI